MKISSGGRRSQGRHDLLGSRLDQGMVAIGLVAQQVVDEEMACRAVQPRVEMERALPAPDVQAADRPRSRRAGRARGPSRARRPTAALLCIEWSAPAEAPAGSRGPGGTAVAPIADVRSESRDAPPARLDRGRSPTCEPVRCPRPSVRTRAEVASAKQTATAIGRAGDRQEVVVLPVETWEGHLGPGRECPARDQPPRGRRARAQQQIGHGAESRPARAASFRFPTTRGSRSFQTARGAGPSDRRCR